MKAIQYPTLMKNIKHNYLVCFISKYVGYVVEVSDDKFSLEICSEKYNDWTPSSDSSIWETYI